MKKVVLTAAAIVAIPLATSANAAPGDTTDADLVTVTTVDYSGRPPFNRKVERLPAQDVAALELEEAGKAVVRTTNFKGRPPFRRNHEYLTVVDVASLEAAEGDDQRRVQFRGRVPARR